MTKSTYKIGLIIYSIVSTIFCYDIVVIDEPFEEYDKLGIIKRTFLIFLFHVPLIKGFVHNRTKSR